MLTTRSSGNMTPRGYTFVKDPTALASYSPRNQKLSKSSSYGKMKQMQTLPTETTAATHEDTKSFISFDNTITLADKLPQITPRGTIEFTPVSPKHSLQKDPKFITCSKSITRSHHDRAFKSYDFRTINQPGVQNYLDYLNREEITFEEEQDFRSRLNQKPLTTRKISQDKLSRTKREPQTSIDPLLSTRSHKTTESSPSKTTKPSLVDLKISLPKHLSSLEKVKPSSPHLSQVSPQSPLSTKNNSSLKRRITNGTTTKHAANHSLAENMSVLFPRLISNYEAFYTYSSMQRESHDTMRNYLLNNPDICDLFYNRVSKEFRDPYQVKKHLHEQFYLSKSPSLLPAKAVTQREPVTFKDSFLQNQNKMGLGHHIKVTPEISKKLKLLNEELAGFNLKQRMREISTLGDQIVKKHYDHNKKYNKLLTKLRFHHQDKYNDLRNIIETVEKDYPYYKFGVAERLEEFETKSGELTKIRERDRSIGRGLDVLLKRWTKLRVEPDRVEKEEEEAESVKKERILKSLGFA